MIRFLPVQLSAASWVLALFVGCGGETGPAVYPVTGTVTYQGQAVEGAVVAFRGESATKIATGTTDSEGRFQLATYQPGDGAVPGKHTVTVSKTIEAGDTSVSLSMDEALENPQAQADSQNELPARYADPATSPIELTVSADDANDFTIELTE